MGEESNKKFDELCSGLADKGVDLAMRFMIARAAIKNALDLVSTMTVELAEAKQVVGDMDSEGQEDLKRFTFESMGRRRDAFDAARMHLLASADAFAEAIGTIEAFQITELSRLGNEEGKL